MQRVLRAKIVWAASCIAIAASAQLPAAAQSISPDGDGTDASEIVVTAQRREQRLNDVPVSVSVVTGEAMARANITTLDAVAERLPNVRISNGVVVNSLSVRGVGSGDNGGFEQAVATFVDGVYRGRSRSTRAALFDIAQIEVLKGPQITFFGNNAIAGALNIATRKPGDQFDYNFSALYGFDAKEYNIQGGVSIPLVDGLSVRLAGGVSGMGGYIKNRTTRTDGPDASDRLGRLAARYQRDGFETDLRFDIGRSRSRNAFSAELVGCPSGPPFSLVDAQTGAPNACGIFLLTSGGTIDDRQNYISDSPATFANYDFEELAWTNRYDFGWASLSAITSYARQDYRSQISAIPTPVRGVLGYESAPAPFNERANQFTQELRLQSAAGGQLEYMVGVYYSRLRTDLNSLFGFYFLPFGAFNPTGTTNADTPVTADSHTFLRDRSGSVFASATLRPIERLRLNLGARYTIVSKRASRLARFGTSVNADPATFTPFDPQTNLIFSQIIPADLGQYAQPERRDRRFMPSIGVQYDLADGVMAYASYSNGFKAGGFSAAQIADTFAPETVDAYEAGLKGRFLNGALDLNLALFRSDYDNLQETTIVFSTSRAPISVVRNAASSRSQGAELGATYRLSPRLTITTDVAYLDSRYRQYPNGACTMEAVFLDPGCVQDLSGRQRPFAPRFSGTLGARGRFPVGTYWMSVDPSLYFSARYFHTATADKRLEEPAFAKVDLRLGFGPDSGRWEVALVGKNLTNRATAAYRNPITFAPAVSTSSQISPGRSLSNSPSTASVLHVATNPDSSL